MPDETKEDEKKEEESKVEEEQREKKKEKTNKGKKRKHKGRPWNFLDYCLVLFILGAGCCALLSLRPDWNWRFAGVKWEFGLRFNTPRVYHLLHWSTKSGSINIARLKARTCHAYATWGGRTPTNALISSVAAAFPAAGVFGGCPVWGNCLNHIILRCELYHYFHIAGLIAILAFSIGMCFAICALISMNREECPTDNYLAQLSTKKWTKRMEKEQNDKTRTLIFVVLTFAFFGGGLLFWEKYTSMLLHTLAKSSLYPFAPSGYIWNPGIRLMYISIMLHGVTLLLAAGRYLRFFHRKRSLPVPMDDPVSKGVRQEHAAMEPAWEATAAGQNEGLQAWRIDGFSVVQQDATNIGEFCKGDAYIILSSKKDPSSSRWAYTLHHLRGTDLSASDVERAWYKVYQLVDYLDSPTTIIWETMGDESAAFKKLYGMFLKYKDGRADDSSSSSSSNDPRFYIIRNSQSDAVLYQAPLAKELVVDGDSFILATADSIYVFDSAKSATANANVAAKKAADLQLQGDGAATIWYELDDFFWQTLGFDQAPFFTKKADLYCSGCNLPFANNGFFCKGCGTKREGLVPDLPIDAAAEAAPATEPLLEGANVDMVAVGSAHIA